MPLYFIVPKLLSIFYPSMFDSSFQGWDRTTKVEGFKEFMFGLFWMHGIEL